MTATPSLPPLPDRLAGLRQDTQQLIRAHALAAYQAGATIELAGHKFSGRDLIGRVMRGMKGDSRYGRERWALVMDTFAVGSTVAHAICHEFDLDPEDVLRK